MPAFGKRSVTRIVNGIRRLENTPANPPAHRPQSNRFSFKIFQGFLREDLAAPTDPLGPPTSALVREFTRQISDDSLVYAREKTVYNYSPGLEADEGTAVMYAKVNGLLQFIWVDCDPKYLTIDAEDGEEITDETGEWLLADVS